MGLKSILIDLKNEIHAKKACIFVLGQSCSGKTTLAVSLSNFFGLKVYDIDDFRENYSNGSIKGENYAYQHFISAVNQARNVEPMLVVCTGISKNFSEIDSRNSIKIFLECPEKILRERSAERMKNGHRSPPFPYDFDRFENTEKIFEEKILNKIQNISKINSGIHSPEKIMANAIVIIYNEIDNIFTLTKKR